MNQFDPISFKAGWQVRQGDNPPVLMDQLPSSSTGNKRLNLQQTFDLEPIGEVCLRFYLHVDAAPHGTTVLLNRREVGIVQAGQSFVVDVTDEVTLEDNILLLKVSQRGTFGAVWLERVPCDNL